MLPAHYAITEVLIVASSIYSIYLLKGRKEFFALIGVMLIGIAATLGAIRYGFNSSETIIKLNILILLILCVIVHLILLNKTEVGR